MAITDDHGKKNNTTTLIQDLFNKKNEETLPDNLLSQNSDVKKKRDNKLFFDNLWNAILIEYVKIYSNMIAFREAQKERRLFEFDMLVKNREREEYNLAQNNAAPPPALTEEQLLKLEMLQTKLQQVISKIDAKIDEYQIIVKIKREQIDILTKQARQLRVDIANQWMAHIESRTTDSDVSTIRIHIPLPQQFSQLPGSTQYKDHINMDKATYLGISREVCNEIAQGQLEAHKLYSRLGEKVTAYIENNFDKHWAFIPQNQRSSMIEQVSTQNLHSIHFMQEVGKEPGFNQKLNEVYKIANQVSKLITEVELMDKAIVELKNMKSFAHLTLSNSQSELGSKGNRANYLERLEKVTDTVSKMFNESEADFKNSLREDDKSNELGKVLDKLETIEDQLAAVNVDEATPSQQDDFANLFESMQEESKTLLSDLPSNPIENPSSSPQLESEEENRYNPFA